MAKKSSIEKNNRRRRMTKKFSGRRARLKAIARDKSKPVEERFAATLKLMYVFASDKHRQAVLVARLDNLGKGASGAAVQNMRLMLGFPEA